VRVYTTYLKLIAKSVYFLPTPGATIPVQVKSVQKRLWLSPIAVHIEVVALFIVAIVGGYIQIVHRYGRLNLNLLHEPGTIASAVSIGARTNLAHLLDGRQQQGDFIKALHNKKFRIDPRTMKIIMQGEEGYDQATSPAPQSFFTRPLSFSANRRSTFAARTPTSSSPLVHL